MEAILSLWPAQCALFMTSYEWRLAWEWQWSAFKGLRMVTWFSKWRMARIRIRKNQNLSAGIWSAAIVSYVLVITEES